MEFSFLRDTPALNLGPRAHVPGVKRKDHEYLLWPAWMFHAVAPRVRSRRLNVIQKAVLGLCRSGVSSSDQIAKPLGLHSDLASFICEELRQKGMLHANLAITDRGTETLLEETIDSHDSVAGYIFSDPWSGKLWPRFVETLDYCEVSDTDESNSKIEFGSTGSPFSRQALRVASNAFDWPPTPASSEIVRAALSHRRMLRNGSQSADEENPLSSSTSVTEDISRASLVTERPEPVFLLTFVYCPSLDSSDGEWHAADPFGLGSSPALRRHIERQMQTDKALASKVRKTIGKSLHENLANYREWTERIRQDAALSLDSLFGFGIRRLLGYEDLLAIETAKHQSEYLGGDISQGNIRQTLTYGRRALEALLVQVAKTFPLKGIWKQTYASLGGRFLPISDRAFLESKFNAAAGAVGFTTPLPESLLGVKPSHIRSVCDYGEAWRLRALFMATLLAARDCAEHPFRLAAADSPGIPTDFETIAAAAGEAAHHSSDLLGSEQINAFVETVYNLIKLLILHLSATEPVSPRNPYVSQEEI